MQVTNPSETISQVNETSTVIKDLIKPAEVKRKYNTFRLTRSSSKRFISEGTNGEPQVRSSRQPTNISNDSDYQLQTERERLIIVLCVLARGMSRSKGNNTRTKKCTKYKSAEEGYTIHLN